MNARYIIELEQYEPMDFSDDIIHALKEDFYIKKVTKMEPTK